MPNGGSIVQQIIGYLPSAVLALFLSGALCACSQKGEYNIADYEQILPQGGIAAITEPEYVSAEEANIDDDSYVLGVIIAGQAYAAVW